MERKEKMTESELWEKYENNLLNRGLTRKRILKLLQMYRTSTRALGELNQQVSREAIEAFVTDLHKDKFTRRDGKKYTGSSKSDIKKFIKSWYKWLEGDNEFWPPKVRWMNSVISKDEKPEEKPVISVEQAQKLASSFRNIETRTLILLLFDSGFRIQEMLSALKIDVTWEEYEEGKNCFWIRCRQSKTEERKIPVPLFTEDLQAFFNSTYYNQLKERDRVFKISYPTFVQSLHRNSLKTLGIKLTPHAFRHSSATYYAKEFEGNMPLLAQRYGWTFSSKQLATYVRRSGAYQKAGVKKVFSNEVARLREENTQITKNMKELETDFKRRMNALKANLLKDAVKELAKKGIRIEKEA